MGGLRLLTWFTIISAGLGSFAVSVISASIDVCSAFIVIPTAIFALAAPQVAIPLFLASLPVFGNRPGSPQSYYLLLGASGLTAGLSVRLLRRLIGAPPSQGENLLSLYCFVSTLSLTGLPWREIYPQFLAQVSSWSDFSALAFALRPFLVAREEQWQYAVLSVHWTLISATLALSIATLARSSGRFLRHCISALLGGLLASLIVGLLDYYSLIDLHWLRALDPVVNPQDKQFRLQSFFGHSGWFAEYVTLSAPVVLAFLLLPFRYSLRVTLIIATLLLGEFVLILTFQRGGWVSYPLTLAAVWSAVYVTRRLEQGDQSIWPALRSSTLKILVTLPLTVILSVALVSGLAHMGFIGSSNRFDVSAYTQRLRDIQKASDRTQFMQAGWKLGLLQPIFGNGSESFAFTYRREFNDPEGSYYNQIILPLHGSAHNVYMQTFAGKGLVGLFSLLALSGYLLVGLLRSVLQPSPLPLERRVISLLGAASLVAFLIYGHVQEVFYVQSLQFLFFAVCGISMAVLPMKESLCRSRSLLFTSLLAALALHLWLKPPPRTADTDYGCYPEERGADATFRWCGPHARISFSDMPSGANRLLLTIQMGPSPFPANEVTIQARSSQHTRSEIPVSSQGRYKIEIPILAAPPSPISVSLATASYFIPAKDFKNSADYRILSYRILSHEWQSNQ